MQESTDKINKGYKDSYFKIIGEKTGKYHIEIKSYQDNTIVLRMFEYDIGSGISESIIDDNKLIISIVKSAIIYLRHNKNTPDFFIVELQTPGGNISYEIPILKSQTYSLDEIFQKKLWYLLPYYLFCYQKDFSQIESDEDKLQKLKNEYKRIKEGKRSIKNCLDRNYAMPYLFQYRNNQNQFSSLNWKYRAHYLIPELR